MNKIFSNNPSYLSQYGKYVCATMLLLGAAAPMMAQDEAEAAAPAKKQAKVAKKYPMMEVKGKVVDAATGEALAGVKLQAYNNKNYTAMTDENGCYTISVPTFVTAISTEYEDYNIATVAIGGRSEDVNVSLYASSFNKDYEKQTVASRTAATTGFERTTAITADQEIQNRLGSDVRAITHSGIAGSGLSMFINGYNSLNCNAQPLIVLDGVVYDMLYDKSPLHTGNYQNLLNAISPDDIEDIKVLKNGTAIYGAKAANGVIIINTKRNKSMATRIDVNIHAGVELRPKTLDVMGAEEYRGYASDLLSGTGTKLTEFKFLATDPSVFSPYYYNQYHNNTDWKKEVYREAWNQNYSIGIQGGDDIASYNLSVGYMDTKTTLKENDMQRFNIRFNSDIILNNWFSTKFDASYTNITRNMRDDGFADNFSTNTLASPAALAYVKAPFLSPYDFSTDGVRSDFLADADTYLDEVLGSNKGSVANPTAILENGAGKNRNYSDNSMVNIAVVPKWQPTKTFSLSERFSYTMQSYDESYYTPLDGMPTYYEQGNSDINNTKASIFSKHNAVFSDTRAEWNILPDGAHRLNAYGGIRFTSDTYTSSDLYGHNTATDKTPNFAGSLYLRSINGVDDNWKNLAYYANFDYNYQQKYYLQAQISMETSSRFGKEIEGGAKFCGVNWAFFPSVQAAWVISNEKWFKPNSGVNYLKLNAGFESVGNDNFENKASLTYMKATQLLGAGMTALNLANIGNTNLKWETTNRFNAGLEGNFINNRLNLKLNYFYSQTNNLVTLGTLSYVAGLTDYYTNDGTLRNQGFDASFNAKVVNNRNFKFELGASVGHYKNKIVKLPATYNNVQTLYGANILTQEGSAAGLFYGYKTDGVYATTADANAAGLKIVDESGKATYFGAGDVKFQDMNGDKVINEKDMSVIGDPNPDIYGNIYANFKFGKRWDVNIGFNYSLGNDVFNYQRMILESGSSFINQTTALNSRWTAEGQLTNVPKATYGDPMGNSRFSDRWIEDGSYLKLKTLSVAYKIPVSNQYIQGISVWAAANNLWTLTKYLGSDPEVSCGNSVLVQGIDAGNLTYGRSFHLGVKINL